MVVDRNKLLAALKLVMPGVESGTAILDGADTFVFQDGNIYSYNNYISVTVPFPGDLKGAVKAADFFGLISRFAENDIKIAGKGTFWSIKCGGAKVDLVLLEESVTKNIQKMALNTEKWNVLPKRFFQGLSQVLMTSSKSSLSGIFGIHSVLVSTDEVRINWYDLDSSFKDSFWITDQAVKELIKLEGITQYILSDNWMHFQNDQGVIFSCKRLQQDKYPFGKIEKLISDNQYKAGDVANVFPDKLLAAINRSTALSMNIESYEAVRLTISSEGAEVYSERATGKYTEFVKWDAPMASISPMVIYIGVSMVEQGLRNSKSFYLKEFELKNKKVIRVIFKQEFGMQLVATLGAN